jgi:1-acyl-sn-glycerol-3-phosphate acyltransferase
VSDLPESSRRHPARYLLHPLRPVARAVIRRRVKVRVVHGEKLPAKGGVILASNHVGVADGPLLAIFGPRPVHALTKQEMFGGPLGWFLLTAGQIPLDREHVDLRAIREAVQALEDGLAVGVFPEGARGAGDMVSPRSGAAYLALVTGFPVVPVSFLGTRMPGGHDGSIPPRGNRIAMTFGHPVHVTKQPWPRTQRMMAETAADVTAAIVDTMREAEELTGMTLPGPPGPKREKKRA